jgi:hypothetical protein
MKWMLLSFAAGIVGFGLMLACSGEVTGAGDAGGTSNRQPPLDSALLDSNSSDESDDDASASEADSIDVENTPVHKGCYTLSGSGSSKECMYSSSPDSDAGCASASTVGSCPSANLFGCCVTTVDGGPDLTAICYYAENKSALDTCSSNQYMGYPEEWQSFAP